MPSRADMDRPASVTTAILGVVLIVVTLPYFLFGEGGGGGNDYLITWSEATAASNQGSVSVGSSSVQLPVSDVRVGNLTVELDPCNDNTVQGLYGPVTITFRVLDGSTEIGRGTATCGSAGPFRFPVLDRPDVGSTSAGSDRAAVAEVWDDVGGQNATTTYTLELTAQRGGGTVPVTPPAGGPSFSATARFEALAWNAVANAQQEDLR